MKKYLLYAGMFLGSFLVINVGMYFLLSAAQPKSAIDTAADSLMADSLATLHGDSTEALHDSASLAHADTVAEAHGDSAAIPETEHDHAKSETTPETSPEITHVEPAEHLEPVPSETQTEMTDGDIPASESVKSSNEAPVSSKEIAKLAKMLEGMKPIEAAAIAERLPDETIVQLVLRMKSRSGAKMMAALPVPIAASVAARMAELSGVGG